jgi:ubiquinone/menaquinone biosynthesis C-methylase UbiE
MNADIERVRSVYAVRDTDRSTNKYSLFNPAALLEYQHRFRALTFVLRAAGLSDLKPVRILDVGCGGGQWLVDFETLGAERSHLCGIDAVGDRVRRAARRVPGADIREGDAARMPWADGTFDLVFQATVLTSILDGEVRRRIAAEMTRVTAPGGAIVSYDFTWNNPRNRDVRGLTRRELSSLFPGFSLRAKSVTLAPPIARVIAPWSTGMASLLEWAGVLNTHCMACLTREK